MVPLGAYLRMPWRVTRHLGEGVSADRNPRSFAAELKGAISGAGGTVIGATKKNRPQSCL